MFQSQVTYDLLTLILVLADRNQILTKPATIYIIQMLSRTVNQKLLCK